MFEDQQRFGRTGIWFAIATVFGIVLYSFLQLMAIGMNWMIMAALAPSLTLFFFLVLLFRRFTLYIKADKKGLEFQFLPVQKELQVVEWQYVSDIELIDLPSLMEFAGWGIQFEEKRVYNISGRKGVIFTFPNKRKLVLGTKKAEELYRVCTEARRKAKRISD